MTIKELMSQVDADRVCDAFILLDYFFSNENYENSFIERYEAIPHFKKIIKDNIKLFSECEPNKDTKPHTIFILSVQGSENYEDSWKKKFRCFATSDDEVFPVLDKDFHVFDDEGEALVSHYSFDNALMEDMVNYVIAESSLTESGKEVCVACILSELFFWGAYPEDREKRVKKISEELIENANKTITEEDMKKSQSFHEKMKQWKDELYKNMSEDERMYYQAKERFEEETRDILSRYWDMKNEKMHKQYIDAIKAEYSKRKNNRRQCL